VTADTRPPLRRLFVAAPIEDEAAATIAALVERVRSQGVPNGGRDVRWVRLDGLHLTLRFIGPTPENRIAAAAEATRAAASTHAPFDVVIGRAGAFPSRGRPRALWLDILAGAPELSAVASSVNAALQRAGWEPDDRPLRAHLTLARSDGVRAGAAIASRLVEAAAGIDVRFRADRIVLFESLTGGGPARYEPLEVVRLGT
jgi:RNA 2',3'-cyclic 3'-phosphodiesterase